MRTATELEFNSFSPESSLSVYITYDETKYIIQLSCKSGKFISQKFFENNTSGIEKMEELKRQYKSELDIKRYFGIV